MKIQLVNSPFDFDEVGQKTALRWFEQGRGVFTTDGKTLVLHPRSTWNQKRREQERDPVTGGFEWFVGDSGNTVMSTVEGCGGMRVFQATHGNPN